MNYLSAKNTTPRKSLAFYGCLKDCLMRMQLTPPSGIGSAVGCADAATAMNGGRYAPGMEAVE